MNLIDPITFKHSSKILKSKNYDDAIAEALTFKKDVKNNSIKKVETTTSQTTKGTEKSKKLLFIAFKICDR